MTAPIRIERWPARNGIADWSGLGASGQAFGRAYMSFLVHSTALLDLRRVDFLTAINEARLAANEEATRDDGMQSVAPATVDHATAFALSIPRMMPLPEIYAESDGHLCFEWYLAPRRVFSVSVSPDAVLSFAKLNGSDRQYGSAVFAAVVPQTVQHNLELVAAGVR